MKIRCFLCVLAIAAVAVLSGCRSTIQDLTPNRLQENPSGIYTFRMKTDFQQTNVVDGSVHPKIVINGETYPMKRNPGLGKNIWEFDYRVPRGQSEVKYYYIVPYQYEQGGSIYDNVRYSSEFSDNKVFNARLINRYVVQLETNRGPVGAEVAALGRGFREYDRVVIGGQEVPTRFQSQNALAFTVPALPAGQSYEVTLRTGEGDLYAGEFLIDASTISVQPSRLDLASGNRDTLIFRIDSVAPAGGLYIDVTTDIPQSIIMPEVIIPEGSRTVSIPVEGAQTGRGSIWITAPGFEETKVSVSVQ